MKPNQQQLINLPLGRKLKKKLPLKVIGFITQLQQENQELLKQLEMERAAKIPRTALTRINQLQ